MNRGATELLRAQLTAAGEIYGWWRAELKELTQFLLRQLPSRKSPELLLRVGGEGASLEQFEAPAWKVVGTLPKPDGVWPAELPGLPPEFVGARTALALPEADLYFDEIELPLAAER